MSWLTQIIMEQSTNFWKPKITIHLLSGEVAEEKKQINHQKSKQKRQKNPLFSSLVISAAVQKVVWIVTKRVKNAPKDYLNIFCFDRK